MSGVLPQLLQPTHQTDGLRDVVTLKHKHGMCQYRYVGPGKCHLVMSEWRVMPGAAVDSLTDVVTLKRIYRMQR